MFPRPSILLALVFCALFTLPTFAESYRLEARRATFILPDGWKKMDAGELAQINQFAAQRAPRGNIQYEAAFRPADSVLGTYPYVLVQYQPWNGSAPSYDSIEREFKKAPEAGSVIVDRDKNRLSFRVKIPTPNGTAVTGVSVGHLRSTGIVFVHSYSADADLDKLLPTFNQLNDSVKFDPGLEYQSPAFDLGSVGNGALRGAMIGGIVGAIAGGVIAPLWWLMKRFQKPKETPKEDGLGQGFTNP